MPINDREFGALSQKVDALERTVGEIRADLKANNKTTDEILLKLSSVSGGWRVLLAVGTTALAIGGLLGKFLPLAFGKI